MTCREFIDFLDEYLTEALQPDVRVAFEDHLEMCLECCNYLESYRRSIRLGKSAFASPDEELPPSVPEHLIKAILASTHPSGKREE